jgi:hypothetical protein
MYRLARRFLWLILLSPPHLPKTRQPMISVRWTWTRVKSSARYTPFKASMGLRIP